MHLNYTFCNLPAMVGKLQQLISLKEMNPTEEKITGSNGTKNINIPLKEVTEVSWLSNFEFWLGCLVLLFGLLIFVLELKFIKNSNAFSPDQTVKVIVVTLIVISTLFIITSGFSSSQIAPAMGLFGTIAGYILGKSQDK